jgi:hypothetical protein
MYPSFVSELEEEPVAARTRECGVERDPRASPVHGVDVQVSEVSFAQRHQVPQSPEVGNQVTDFLSLTGDAEYQLGSGRHGPGIQHDLVIIDAYNARRIRELSGLVVAGRVEVGAASPLAAPTAWCSWRCSLIVHSSLSVREDRAHGPHPRYAAPTFYEWCPP